MAEKRMPYYNRELSWMDFNARVLEEATKKENPLMERAALPGPSPGRTWMNFSWCVWLASSPGQLKIQAEGVNALT